MEEIKTVKNDAQANAEVTPEKSNDSEALNPSLIKLQWLAERARKAERIKRELEAGTYQVDSLLIAKALLNLDQEN